MKYSDFCIVFSAFLISFNLFAIHQDNEKIFRVIQTTVNSSPVQSSASVSDDGTVTFKTR